MELLASAWDIAMHLDAHLADFVAAHGAWVYALMFVVVFIDTGLVIWPFLPGDSLLFATGAIAAAGGMDIAGVMTVAGAAGRTGGNADYFNGRCLGACRFPSLYSVSFDPPE